jgi:hypothetical protein
MSQFVDVGEITKDIKTPQRLLNLEKKTRLQPILQALDAHDQANFEYENLAWQAELGLAHNIDDYEKKLRAALRKMHARRADLFKTILEEIP